MFPYWILFSYFAVGAVRSTAGKLRLAGLPRLLLGVGFVSIIIMIGVRYRVGGDWYAYQRIFNAVDALSLREALGKGDPGYMAINWAVSQVGLEVWAVNVVCGSIFAWGLFRFAAIQPNPWLTSLVAIPYLVIVVAMGYTRQGVALGLLLAGLASLTRGAFWRFVAWAVLATTFHKSSIVILPIVALSRNQNRVVAAMTIFATSAILYYLLIEAEFATLVTNYIVAEYESEGAGIRVAMNIPPALLCFALRNRFGFSDEEARLWRNFSIAAFVALVLLFSVSSSTAVDRLALTLIPLQLVIFGRLPDAILRNRSSGLAIVGVILYSAAVQFVWLNYAKHAEDWVPYRVFPFGEGSRYAPQ